jgi:hypothetical protein
MTGFLVSVSTAADTSYAGTVEGAAAFSGLGLFPEKIYSRIVKIVAVTFGSKTSVLLLPGVFLYKAHLKSVLACSTKARHLLYVS